ncbi:short-chain dehydrogenase [Serratia marcescens]|nr:short-chain dehydrogenase [Serratia marcescens]
MNALNGKVAVIGGASSGIGRAAALLFARQGLRWCWGAARAAVGGAGGGHSARGGRALAVAGDVRDEAFAERLTATAVDEFGGLDIAFNNAGTLGPLGPSLALTAPEWREVLETNLSSAYYGAKYQIPAMLARGAGSVIFTSTFVGHTAAFPGTAAYAAGKSGLIGLTQALAVEFGGRGIRVNALLPGGTDTAMGRQMSNTPEALAQVADLHALKRLAMPEEIAQAALYLASDASSFVTGTAMLVDGGVSIQRG